MASVAVMPIAMQAHPFRGGGIGKRQQCILLILIVQGYSGQQCPESVCVYIHSVYYTSCRYISLFLKTPKTGDTFTSGLSQVDEAMFSSAASKA